MPPRGTLAEPKQRHISPKGPRIVEGNWAGRTPRPQRAPGGRGKLDEYDQRSFDDDGLPVYRVGDDLRASRAEGGSFSVGTSVQHVIHGQGRVIAVSGSGKDAKVVVEFASVGEKTVYPKYLVATEGDLN